MRARFQCSRAGTSWAAQYLRIGILVMYVHDVSDIFVDVMKMANYLKLEGRRGFYASEIAYAATMISWVYYRLWVFPFSVIHSSVWEVNRLLAPHALGWRGLVFPPDLPYFTEMNALLCSLVVRKRTDLVNSASQPTAVSTVTDAVSVHTYAQSHCAVFAHMVVLFAGQYWIPHRDGVGQGRKPAGIRGR